MELVLRLFVFFFWSEIVRKADNLKLLISMKYDQILIL
jgi:hypothetical protein